MRDWTVIYQYIAVIEELQNAKARKINIPKQIQIIRGQEPQDSWIQLVRSLYTDITVAIVIPFIQAYLKNSSTQPCIKKSFYCIPEQYDYESLYPHIMIESRMSDETTLSLPEWHCFMDLFDK